MNTPPASSSRPPNASAAPERRPHAAAPRQQAERQSINDRFAAKLEREDSAKGAQRRDAGERGMIDDGALPALFSGERDAGDDGAQPDLGHREAHLRLTAAANVAGVAPPVSSALDSALLSQIAAQIADSASSAGASEASIEFPAGSLAESALIRREADGSIAIRIAGIDPRLSALQNARAQMELRAALAQRRLQVSSVTLERGRAEEPDQNPAISRVV